MIFEVMVTVIADDVNEAHEAIVQLADSRGGVIQEINADEIVIEGVDPEPSKGYAVNARMTPGRTPPPAPTPRPRPKIRDGKSVSPDDPN